MTQSSQISPYILKIDSSHAGQRLDNFLINQLKGVPKSHLYRIIRKGEVRVNKMRYKAHNRLALNDEVRVPPIRLSKRENIKPSIAAQNTVLGSAIFEDEHILVLNKPSGWPVHGGSGRKIGIIEVLKFARENSHYIELIHRLDKQTSGCLMIAKSRQFLTGFQQLLRNHDAFLVKSYTTLLKGQWTCGIRRVDAGLSIRINQYGEKVSWIDLNGKKAVTEFTPSTIYEQTSLMKASIMTGRMHQIRAHSVYLSHPVAGDNKYGDFEFNRYMKKHYGLNRMFLHASRIKFRHPITRQKLSFESPLPKELMAVLDKVSYGPFKNQA